MPDKTSARPDILGLFSTSLVKVGRFAIRHLGKEKNSFPSRIMLCWKRNDVCVETKERGKDYVTKEYPQLVDKGWAGHNQVLKYRIPSGLGIQKVIKSIYDIEFDLKSEVLFKRLENDPEAHFSLTILSGHLLDYIEYKDEAVKLSDKGICLPIGWSRRGLEQIDIASDKTPHLMIGGGAGAGKSTLGRLMLACLHFKYTREDVRLWLCDLKHGTDIDMLGDDPLLVDKKISGPEHVEQTMDELMKVIGERFNYIHGFKGCHDIKTFNKKHPDKKLPHIICFIDELTKLEGKEFQVAREKMSKVTGEGRAAGVHMIISCHRPTANLVSGTMKNNIPAVVAFRCNPVSARVLLGEDEWESSQMIDKDIEGRAIFKFKDEVLVQVPYIDDDRIEQLMAAYQKPKKEQPNTLVKSPKTTPTKSCYKKDNTNMSECGNSASEKQILKLVKTPKTITRHEHPTKG